MALRHNPIQGLMNAYEPNQVERLNQLQSEFQANPGAAPGGTGSTGLLPNDIQGYNNLLNRRAEYLQLMKGLQGAAG